MKLSTRRRGDLSRELAGFFAHEPGAISSNFRGIANLALSGVRTDGGSAFADDAAIQRMHRIHRAVGHHEAIRKALRALDGLHETILWLAFGAHKLPPEARKALGETAAAALLTEAAREGCKNAAGTSGEPTFEQVGAWLLRACVAGDTATLRPVIEARDELVEIALCAYAAARRADGPKAEQRAVEGQKGGRGSRGAAKRRTPIGKLLGVQ